MKILSFWNTVLQSETFFGFSSLIQTSILRCHQVVSQSIAVNLLRCADVRSFIIACCSV